MKNSSTKRNSMKDNSSCPIESKKIKVERNENSLKFIMSFFVCDMILSMAVSPLTEYKSISRFWIKAFSQFDTFHVFVTNNELSVQIDHYNEVENALWHWIYIEYRVLERIVYIALCGTSLDANTIDEFYIRPRQKSESFRFTNCKNSRHLMLIHWR